MTDKNGRAIQCGDLLRTYHFTGARRRKHYLYHMVRWNAGEQWLEAVPVGELAAPPQGGRFWIRQSIIDSEGCEVIESRC